MKIALLIFIILISFPSSGSYSTPKTSAIATASPRIWDIIFKPIIISCWVEGALPWEPASKDLAGSPPRGLAGRLQVIATPKMSFTELR